MKEKCAKARTQKQQAAITPDEAVKRLKDGNARFYKKDKKMKEYCYLDMAKQTASGQFPFAAVLSCVDSRIPVEIVFNQDVGDLFVARVAGNFVNTDIIGSLEFAVASGVKTILILGHTSCGAIKGACNGATGLPALDSMLSNLEPAVKSAITSTGAIATATNPAFVQAAADANVKITMANLRSQSALINNAIGKYDADPKDGIRLIGGMYHLDTGKVEIFKSRT